MHCITPSSDQCSQLGKQGTDATCLIFKQHCKSLQTNFHNTYVNNSISITGWCQQLSEVRSPLIPSLASVVSPLPTTCEKEILPITCSDHIKLSSIITHKNHIYGIARLLLALTYTCSFHQAGTRARVAQEQKEQSSLAKHNSAIRAETRNTVCKNIRDPSLQLKEMDPSSAGIKKFHPLALMTSARAVISLPSGLVGKWKDHINQQSKSSEASNDEKLITFRNYC